MHQQSGLTTNLAESVSALGCAAYLKALKCRQKVQPEHPRVPGEGIGGGMVRFGACSRMGVPGGRQTPDMRRHPTHHSCCFWVLIVLSVWQRQQQLHRQQWATRQKKKSDNAMIIYSLSPSFKSFKSFTFRFTYKARENRTSLQASSSYKLAYCNSKKYLKHQVTAC